MKPKHSARLGLGLLLVLLMVPFLVLGLLVMMILGSPRRENPSGLEECGLTAAAVTGPVGSTEDQQLANARIIDEAARNAGLSGLGTLVGLVAAIGESDLLALDYGDRDSLGLFQQRPSQGWGTAAQVMDPMYAATSFYIGPRHDRTAGLVSISGWESMPITAAIHAVQKNFDPDWYAPFEGRARAIAAEAGIDLTRPGSDGGSALVAKEGCGSGLAISLEDGPCPIDHAGTSGINCNAAIAFATKQMNSGSRDWYRLCLGLVSQAYGSVYAGIPTAYAGALMVQARGHMQPPTTNYASIPRGALVWYDGRASGNSAGHVAISLGDGMAISNDVPVNDGRVGVVPISYFETNWGQRFMGWSPPAK